MKGIEAQEQLLMRALFHGTEKQRDLLGIPTVTMPGQTGDLANHESIVSFPVNGMATEELVDYFETNGVRVHNRFQDASSKHTLDAFGIEACIRTSLFHYNRVEEVNRFLELLAAYSKC